VFTSLIMSVALSAARFVRAEVVESLVTAGIDPRQFLVSGV
jgi:hypothetical protein